MSWLRQHKLATLFIILAICLFTYSSYLTFHDESTTARTYIVKNFERAKIVTNEQPLQVPAIVVPTTEYTIFEELQNVAELVVNRGDIVTVDQPLFYFNNESSTFITENKISAFETELSSYQSILVKLQKEQTSLVSPNSYITAEQSEDLLNIQVDLQLQQQMTLADAISDAESRIVAVERELSILNAELKNNIAKSYAVSPVDGVIGEITKNNQMLTVTIYSSNKSLLTYVQEDSWHKIELNQRVKGPLIDNIELDGIVSKKNEVVVNEENIWANEYSKQYPLTDDSYYEVMLDYNGELANYPYASKHYANIILKTINSSYTIPTEWLKHTDDVIQHYAIDDFGKVQLVIVDEHFMKHPYSVVTSNMEHKNPIIEHDEQRVGSRVAMTFVLGVPTLADVKSFDWRKYLAAIVR